MLYWVSLVLLFLILITLIVGFNTIIYGFDYLFQIERAKADKLLGRTVREIPKKPFCFRMIEVKYWQFYFLLVATALGTCLYLFVGV